MLLLLLFSALLKTVSARAMLTLLARWIVGRVSAAGGETETTLETDATLRRVTSSMWRLQGALCGPNNIITKTLKENVRVSNLSFSVSQAHLRIKIIWKYKQKKKNKIRIIIIMYTDLCLKLIVKIFKN